MTTTGTFGSLYNLDSSLAVISGYWIGDDGNVMNINVNGVIFVQDPVSGCVVNGQVSIIDANYNAYAVRGTYSNCTGSAAVLNGRTGTGLATIDNTVVPALLINAVSVTLADGQLILAASVAAR